MLSLVEKLFKKHPLHHFSLLSSLIAVISNNESTEFIKGHVIYNLAYTYKFQLKTTQIGETMKHAGVAITVTSITDVFAFGIGAVTVSKYEEDFLSFINFINFCSTFCQGHLGYSVHGCDGSR